MTTEQEQRGQAPHESAFVLYICPRDGRWLAAMGIAESIAKAFGGTYEQRCPECHDIMARAGITDRIRILVAPPQETPVEQVFSAVASLGPVGTTGIGSATGLPGSVVEAALRLLLSQGIIQEAGDILREGGEGIEPGYMVTVKPGEKASA